MKIIIVGAGISGLSTYLYLRKHLPNPPSPAPPHTVHIYESYRPKPSRTPVPPADASAAANKLNPFEFFSASTAAVGGGLGVSANGMRILRDLSPEIHRAVVAQGFPCDCVIFMGQNGWMLGRQSTSDNGGIEGPKGQAEVCVSSTRHGLWACLMAAMPEGAVQYRRVLKVVRREESGKKVVVFADGGEEECDVLIGADGVKSMVRRALFGDDEEGGEKYRTVYTGVSWVGGIVKRPLPPNVADNRAIVTAFGRKGLFAYSSGSPASSNELMWLSAFATEEPPSRDSITIKEIAADVRKRYGAWGDPVVRDIVSTAPIETVYPIWVLPDLPHWGQDGIVLVGDAAHAMSPTTAQGACQALEDAQALALLLCETLRKAYDSGEKLDKGADIWPQKERDAVELSIRLLFTIRSPRVSGIAEAGRQLDRKRRNLTRFKEYAMYLFLWLMFRLSSLVKLLTGDSGNELYGWSAKEMIRKALAESDSTV